MSNEENAKTLIDEQLRELGWDLTNFSIITKEYPLPTGKKADYAILIDGSPVALIEAKKEGVGLAGALIQAKNYAKLLNQKRENVLLIFASDGKTIYRQNIKANTRPEKIDRFPTYAEIKDYFHPETDYLLANLREYQKIALFKIVMNFFRKNNLNFINEDKIWKLNIK